MLKEQDWGRELTPAEITQEFAEQFYEDCVSGWYDDEPIEWEEAIDRWEGYHRDENVTFGSEWDSPAIRRLQRLVRAIKAEAG